MPMQIQSIDFKNLCRISILINFLSSVSIGLAGLSAKTSCLKLEFDEKLFIDLIGRFVM